MEITIPVLLFVVGLVLVIGGGDVFVDAARWISDVTGIPKFIIGATIVSLATTMPELLVSLFATAGESVDMAVGNAVGSVTSNIGLIMGISAIAMPCVILKNSFSKKALLMLFSTLMLGLLILDGSVSSVDCLLLIALLGVFIVINFVGVGAPSEIEIEKKKACSPATLAIIVNSAKFIVGAACVGMGAKLLVDNGKILALAVNISESVIGIAVMAVGTSLPELVTTLMAIAKKESALSVGNVLGANIIDITLILSSCSFVAGGTLFVQPQTYLRDIPVTLSLMVIAVVPSIISGKLARIQGILLIGGYVSYLFFVITGSA